ncbi:hypothetical protein ACVWWH_003766 [Sinomonas sp. RB5]
MRQLAEIASVAGVGQKAGVALAATGLVLTVTVPTATQGAAATAASSDQPQVTAAADAVVPFARASVGSAADPDGRLKQMLGAESAGGITPAQAQHALAPRSPRWSGPRRSATA